MNRSIRFRLTMWYVGILTAALCLFGWLFYKAAVVNRMKDTDQLLALRADGIADTVAAFWQAESEAHRDGSGGVAKTLRKEIEEGRFPALLDHWAQDTGELEAPNPVCLMDRHGMPLAFSPSYRPLLQQLSRITLARARHGRPFFETIAWHGNRQRLITWPVSENGRVLYLVQVAESLAQSESSLRRLRTWVLCLIPLTLAVACVGGWFLATTALHPVGRMVTQAQRIGVEHLHERIDVPHTGDEMERLAVTFNDMLSRLEQAFRQMRQFSAAASHELRTPLTVMKGELEVALRRTRDVGEYQRVLRTQLDALNEMAGTVEQLLALARSDPGKGALEWLPVEIGSLAMQTRDAWLPVATAKNITLDVRAEQAVWVRGERRLLTRLMGNLLDNAIHHTPNEGFVTLQSASDGGEACITVQDTGPGIPEQEMPRIFEKFFTRPSAGDDPRSTGLGLGLCRWITEAHKGRIEVQTAAGEGSKFIVRLPLAVSAN